MHVGAGSSTGTIDLPIQREKHTNFPHIEGSSLRGAIREAAWATFLKKESEKESEKESKKESKKENDIKSEFNRYFGKSDDDGSLHLS